VDRPPLVTDEWPDRVWGRPVARLLLPALLRTRVTANQVTGIATLFGVAAGIALGLQQGVLFLVLVAVYLALDCADGEVARRGRGGGVLGRLADGVGDYVTAVAVHLGWILWIAAERGAASGLLLGMASGASMAWSSFLLDRYKRRYRGDVDDVAEVRAAVEASRGLWRHVYRMFLPYAAAIAADAEVPDRARYQRAVRVPMLLWLTVGPTMHFVAMALCAVLGDPVLYAFLAVVPFNLATLLALALQARGEASTRQPEA
jgi:phosphatidylglycerophosphate synthase